MFLQVYIWSEQGLQGLALSDPPHALSNGHCLPTQPLSPAHGHPLCSTDTNTQVLLPLGSADATTFFQSTKWLNTLTTKLIRNPKLITSEWFYYYLCSWTYLCLMDPYGEYCSVACYYAFHPTLHYKSGKHNKPGLFPGVRRSQLWNIYWHATAVLNPFCASFQLFDPI